MASPQVDLVLIPGTLRVGACMPGWAPGHVDIKRQLNISAGESREAVQLLVDDQRFLDYFTVSSELTLSQLHVVAPAAVTATPARAFLPVIFTPLAAGVVIFDECVVTLTRPDAHAFDPTPPAAVFARNASPVAPDRDLSRVRALGAAAALRGLHEVSDAHEVERAAALQLLADRGTEFARRLSSAGGGVGWRFRRSFAVAVSAYAGGTLVADGPALSRALNTSSISQIFVQNDVDIGAVFEAQAVNASTSRYFITRDLLIYGEPGAALDFRWSAEVVRVRNASLTISGGLVLQRMSRPTLSSLPYNCFLGAFVFESDSTLHLHDVTVEHAPTLDLELWALAGSTDPAHALPNYDNHTWSATNYLLHQMYNSRRVLSAIQMYLPPVSQPAVEIDGSAGAASLTIRSWVVDEATWDAAVYGRLNPNGFFAAYDLQNVSLAAPASNADECDGTAGTPVSDSAGLRAALNDPSIYRIKLVKSFAIVPSDWPQPDNQTAGIAFTRRARLVGCESESAYTVLDTANMFRVVYLMQYASIQLARLRLTNLYLAPRRLNIELLVGMFSALDNATLNFQDCAFEGASAANPGSLVSDSYLQQTASPYLTPLFPNASYTVTLHDAATNQTSRLLPHAAFVLGPFIALTQGNLSAADTLRASYNYVGAVVSSAPTAPHDDGDDNTLALAIALPLAGVALLACCAVAVWLLVRRQRRRNGEKGTVHAPEW